MIVSFNMWVHVLKIIGISLIAGLPITYWFFKDEKIRKIELMFISLGLGLLLPPLVSFLLIGFTPLKFASWVPWASTLFVFLLGLLLVVWEDKEKLLKHKLKFKFKPDELDLRSLIVPSLLVFLVFLSFFIRYQSWSPVYQELDPYFYMYGTTQILTLGEVPEYDTTAWYPLAKSTHRGVPVLHYMYAHWYVFATGGTEYNKYLLSTSSSIYPAIVAGLMTFFIYLLVKIKFGERWGLLSASIIALLPSMIMKLAASVSEAQPMTMFLIPFSLSIFLYVFEKRKECKNRLFFLSGMVSSLVYLSSTGMVVPSFTVIGFVGIVYLLYYLLNDEDLKFDRRWVYFSIPVFLSVLILHTYITNYGLNLSILKDYAFLLSISVPLIPLVFTYLKKANSIIGKTIYHRLGIVIVLAVIFLLFIIHNFGFIFSQQTSYISALDKTIQEGQQTGASLEGYLGYLGSDSLSLLSKPFTVIVNSILKITDAIFSKIFNVPFKTIPKSPAPIMFFITVIFAILVYEVVRVFKDNKFDPSVWFYLIFIIPLLFAGLNKVKVMTYLSLAISVGIGMSFWYIERMLKHLFKHREKEVEYGLIGLAIILVILTGLSMAFPILSTSLQVRYQEDPYKLISKFQEICSLTNDPDICSATDPDTYIQDINDQFNTKLCFYSLIPINEIRTGNISQWTQMSASYRCSKIPDPWLSSMEWISKNTPEGSRITSWWDYGHWINFFGERNAVLRNEHASHYMIQHIGWVYTHGNETDLRKAMDDYYSDYVLIDREVSGPLGGKFHALNYLGCNWVNRTNYLQDPGTSECEHEVLWETIGIPTSKSSEDECTISLVDGRKGVKVYHGSVVRMRTSSGVVSVFQPVEPVYCMDTTPANTSDGMPLYLLYELNERDENGDLKIHGGLPQIQTKVSGVDGKDYLYGFMMYLPENITLSDGRVVDMWSGHGGMKFYESVVYKGYYLGYLDGFDKVYDDGYVKIYKKR